MVGGWFDLLMFKGNIFENPNEEDKEAILHDHYFPVLGPPLASCIGQWQLTAPMVPHSHNISWPVSYTFFLFFLFLAYDFNIWWPYCRPFGPSSLPFQSPTNLISNLCCFYNLVLANWYPTGHNPKVFLSLKAPYSNRLFRFVPRSSSHVSLTFLKSDGFWH